VKRKWLRRIGWTFFAIIVLEIVIVQAIDYFRSPEYVKGLKREFIRSAIGYDVSYLTPLDAEPTQQRVIYVHGTPGTAEAFDRYLYRPIPGLEPVSLDRPGFGHTKPLKPVMTLHEQAAAVAPLLVERDGHLPILVGHSMGAPIIWQVAAEFPDRVGGLVILAGALDPALEKKYWYNRVGSFLFVPYMLPRVIRHSNEELAPLKGELEKLKPMLKNITCPVIIMHAPDDMLVPFANVAYMEKHLPQSETIVLEGKNHFIPWNSEAAVRDAIRSLMPPSGEVSTEGEGD
jgi:pimeloyl-ACP methyl ester carboxylesterase